MINIKIGNDGKPNEVTVIVGNKGENLDETLQFEMPNEFVGFHKYLVVVNKKQEETKTMVFPIVDNQLTITYDITKEPGKYSMYVMAREYELETLEGEIVLTPKSYERVFISDALIGVVNDTEIDSEMFVNENTALQPTVTVFPKTKEQDIRPKVGFYGLSKVVVKSIYDDDEEVYLPNRNSEFTNFNGQYKYRYMTSDTLIENDKYKVVWDGSEYYCTCRNSSNGLFIGNASYCGEADDKIPFVIVKNESARSMDITSVYDTSSTTHNIEFYHLVYRFQTKTVTPTAEQQTIVADEGFYGLEKVIVEPGGNVAEETVIFDGTYTTVNMDGMFGIMIESSFEFTDKNKYKVTLDGVTYECVVTVQGMTGIIGNTSMMGGEDTGEPFLGMAMDGMVMFAIFTDTAETEHTLTMTETEVPKLVPKGMQIGVKWQGGTDTETDGSNFYKMSDYNKPIKHGYGIVRRGTTIARIGDLEEYDDSRDYTHVYAISGYPCVTIYTEDVPSSNITKGMYFRSQDGDYLCMLVFDEA